VKKRFDDLLAGGQDHLKGKVFRIALLGFVCDRDILTAVAAIEATLQDLGLATLGTGAGVTAAAKELAKGCWVFWLIRGGSVPLRTEVKSWTGGGWESAPPSVLAGAAVFAKINKWQMIEPNQAILSTLRV
jgi:hypothetical protein